MVFSVTTRACVLAVTLTCIFLSCCMLGKAEEEEVPYEGGGGGIGGAAGGTGAGGGGVGGAGSGGIGGTGGGGIGGGGGGGGGGIGGSGSGGGGGIGGAGGGGIGGGGVGGGGDPAEIVAKALLCFNDRYIYSSCEESYRLTESGNLNVSPDHTEEYCHGPCLTETHLVLDCIDNILAHFLFYNRATIGDVRDTIKAGCGYGPERGNFDVSEHIEAEEGRGNKVTGQILLPVVSLIMGAAVLLQY